MPIRPRNVQQQGSAGVGLSAPFSQLVQLAVVTYDFAVDGGATVAPAKNFVVPPGFVHLGGVLSVWAASGLTSGGLTTVALNLTTTTATILLAATAKASLAAGATVALTPTTTAKNTVLTPNVNDSITVTIATGPLTAGKFDAFIMFAVANG